MIRDGSWNNKADNLRAANRNNNDPGNRNHNIGFRPVLRYVSLDLFSKSRYPVMNSCALIGEVEIIEIRPRGGVFDLP